MVRRARTTSGKVPRWITGTRKGAGWVLYWDPTAKRLRVMFHRMQLGRFDRWKAIQWGETAVAKRLTQDADAGGAEGKSVDPDDLAALCPNLCSWLLDAKYDDGSVKGKTRLQVERRGNQLVCVLKDADSGLCLTAAHESASDALMTMELLLGSEDCPWLLDPWPLSKPKGKRKK